MNIVEKIYSYVIPLLILICVGNLCLLGCDSEDETQEEQTQEMIEEEDEEVNIELPTWDEDERDVIHLPFGNLISDENGILSFEINVPDGARSFIISIHSARLEVDPVITFMQTPTDEILIDQEEEGGIDASGELGQLNFLHPASPERTWVNGRYFVEVVTADSFGSVLPNEECQVDVLFDMSEESALQNLDLLFWFSEGDYLSATEAQESDLFQEGVTVLRDIFQRGDITIRSIEYRDLGTRGEEFAVITNNREKVELFSLADRDRNQMNVFFIDAIQDGEDQAFVTLGEASGIPATPAYPELQAGGVIISGTLLENANRLGETVAHEIGHALGLTHTSEESGEEFDPLLDTLECSIENDLDGDGSLSAEECVDNGAENLMYWTAPLDHETPQNELSEDQFFVLERSITIQ